MEIYHRRRRRTAVAAVVALGVLAALIVVTLVGVLTPTSPRPDNPLVTATSSQRAFVPFYVPPSYPNYASDWERLRTALPPGSVVITDAPAIGSGATAAIAAEQENIRRAQAVGLRVLVYIPTNYGAQTPQRSGDKTWGRTLADVRGYVDQAYAWYAPDGVYFDEVSQFAAGEGFYRTLRDDVRAQGTGRGTTVWLNVSAYPTYEGLMQLGDVIQLWERPYGEYADDNSYNAQVPPWIGNYAPERIAHTILGCVGEEQMLDAVARSKRRGAGWVFPFDGNNQPGNGYDHIPPDPSWTVALRAIIGEGSTGAGTLGSPPGGHYFTETRHSVAEPLLGTVKLADRAGGAG